MKATGTRTPEGAWIGASVGRREDPRLLTGRGRFIDDMELPGMLHAQFVRSTVAHATVTSLDLSAVRDSARRRRGVQPPRTWSSQTSPRVLGRPLSEFVPTAMPVLARDRVRFVGEPMAMVSPATRTRPRTGWRRRG